MIVIHNNKLVEIEQGKFLNINDSLYSDQHQNIIQVLQNYKGAFAWDYLDMKGINP